MRKTWAARGSQVRAAAALAVGLSLAGQVLAVNRCTLDDGRVVYQDTPCPAVAAASRVRLFTPPSDPAGRQRAAADAATATRLTRAAEPVPAPAVGLVNSPTQAQQKGPVAALADACLNFYRSSLRDPASAYWSGASLDKLDVLWMTLHATNGYGGFVPKTVGCEVRHGQLDVDRTRANAGRLGM